MLWLRTHPSRGKLGVVVNCSTMDIPNTWHRLPTVYGSSAGSGAVEAAPKGGMPTRHVHSHRDEGTDHDGSGSTSLRVVAMINWW